MEDLLDLGEVLIYCSLAVSGYVDQAVDVLLELRQPFVEVVVELCIVDHAILKGVVVDLVCAGHIEAELHHVISIWMLEAPAEVVEVISPA